MTIALQLLFPNESNPQQNWLFKTESVIRIGRSTDNQIVLDSSAISEYHAMLWGYANEWKIVNLSCNGTYLNEKPITHALLRNCAVIRLAASGPQIRFQYLGTDSLELDSLERIPPLPQTQKPEVNVFNSCDSSPLSPDTYHLTPDTYHRSSSQTTSCI
jgi:pSer/pThr/pTyr-binding forkhead associated (FHA) protein